MDNKEKIMRMIDEYNKKKHDKNYKMLSNEVKEMKETLKAAKIQCLNEFIENIKKLPLVLIYPFQNTYNINITYSNSRINGFLFSSSLLPESVRMVFSIKEHSFKDTFNAFIDYTFSLYPVMGEENDLFILTNKESITLPYIIKDNVLNDNLDILKDFEVGNEFFNYKVLEDDLCKAIQETIKEKYNDLLNEEKKIMDEHSRLAKEINEMKLF